MNTRFFLGFTSVIALCAAIPLAAQEETKGDGKAAAKDVSQPVALIAVVSPTVGNALQGAVTFEPLEGDHVRISVHLTGLKPFSAHGFHVHTFGDLSAVDGSTVGGHFDPKGQLHGLPPDQTRHVGDLGNLMTDKNGEVKKSFEVDGLPLTGKHSILGRSVVLHAKTDTGEEPSGSAGDRIGFGVIGYRNPASSE